MSHVIIKQIWFNVVNVYKHKFLKLADILRFSFFKRLTGFASAAKAIVSKKFIQSSDNIFMYRIK